MNNLEKSIRPSGRIDSGVSHRTCAFIFPQGSPPFETEQPQTRRRAIEKICLLIRIINQHFRPFRLMPHSNRSIGGEGTDSIVIMPAIRKIKIALVSPKGPLYRHRGGIWKKSLRYQPLTLTTLAALIPPELNATVELYDEGIA